MRRVKMRVLAGIGVSVAVLTCSNIAARGTTVSCATAGCLDESFGSGGIDVLNLKPGAFEYPTDVAAQPDGKILVVGTLPSVETFVARVNSDGSLDSNFGTGGVTKPWSVSAPGFASAFAIAVAPDLGGDTSDFDIVIAGTTTLGKKANKTIFGCAVARLNSNGTFEALFGTQGLVTFSFVNGNDSNCYAAAIDQVGRIVVGGSSSSANFYAALARLNANGTVDMSFGQAGKLVTTDRGEEAYSTIANSNGILVGTGKAILHFDLAGNLDHSFGANGRVDLPFDGANVHSNLVTDAAGRIFAGGYVASGVIKTGKPPKSISLYDFAVAAFSMNGQTDTTFGNHGVATFNVGDNDSVTGLAIDAAGRIVVSGESGSGPRFVVARLLGDGALDFSFGGTGVVATDVNYNAVANAGVVVTPAGIVLAGSSSASGNPPKTTLIRYVQY